MAPNGIDEAFEKLPAKRQRLEKDVPRKKSRGNSDAGGPRLALFLSNHTNPPYKLIQLGCKYVNCVVIIIYYYIDSFVLVVEVVLFTGPLANPKLPDNRQPTDKIKDQPQKHNRKHNRTTTEQHIRNTTET